MKKIDEVSLLYIVERLLESYEESTLDSKNDNSDFQQGRQVAYYEMLDIIKSELEIADADLKEYGLDINLEEKL